MSDSSLARRTKAQVVFAGTDISTAINEDLLSLTFTDNEEDSTDDLQIKVSDREGKWLRKWLGNIVSEAAAGGEILSTPESAEDSTNSGSGSSSGSGGSNSGNSYKVTASSGVNVRSAADE
ncbi:MAG: hypothetical protein NC228_10120, partial [[Eubacterium] siraeum]|nr:hypothetical protein [[Eubacterium] siraeum]